MAPPRHGLALAVPQIKIGLSQTEKFTSVPEAVVGQEIIADAFSAGSGSPVVVITNADYADEVVSAAEAVDGVSSAAVGETNGEITVVSREQAAKP